MSDILTMRRKTVSSPMGSDPASVAQTEYSISVGTTATALPTTPATGRDVLIIYNNSTSTVFLGDLAVTTANGMPLQPGAYFVVAAGPNLAFYGRVASGTANVRVMELG